MKLPRDLSDPGDPPELDYDDAIAAERFRVRVAPLDAPRPRYPVPTGVALARTISALRQRQPVDDEAFDAIFPEAVRLRSAQYWTPIAVARRAAEMLVRSGASRVLDVGSGAGKFCLIGALTTPLSFTGIEHRPHLVDLARALSGLHGATRATFVQGDMRDVDWRAHDAFYFFNPFAENYFDAEDQFDDSVDLVPERFDHELRFVVTALEKLPLGTRVVTYHGLGCDTPFGYERILFEPAGTGFLELWIRTIP